jgi:hypothetical protein
MPDKGCAGLCELCGRRGKITREEEFALSQWTDRGYVSCRVTIPVSNCSYCKTRSWDEAAEAVIEEAVRKAYDQLS